MESIRTEDTRNFIVENYLFGDGNQLTDQTSFMAEGIIDSTGILELIGFLEDTYQIKVNDDEVIPENMDSLEKISRYISAKLVDMR